MKRMTKRQKLGVALGAAIIVWGIGLLGMTTTWISWKTAAWAVVWIASLVLIYRIAKMREEVTQ